MAKQLDEAHLDVMREMCASVELLVARGRTELDADEVLQPALERTLSKLSGASTAVGAGARAELRSVPWSALAKLHTTLSHHYWTIDRDLLWETATGDIPLVADVLGRSSAK